jgi:hypothetical protein
MHHCQHCDAKHEQARPCARMNCSGCLHFTVSYDPILPPIKLDTTEAEDAILKAQEALGVLADPSRASARKSTANLQDSEDPEREWWEE